MSALAGPHFFQEAGRTADVVFALMPVSVGLTHAVAVALHSAHHRCSCALRHRPCVHALALAAWYEQGGADAFPFTETLPDWVERLQESKHSQHAARPADTLQAAARKTQRYLERLERAACGLDDLEYWLLDVARRGLATTLSEQTQPFSAIATRMADASLPGLARLFRNLNHTTQADQVEETAAALGAVYLALRSFRRRDDLPLALLYDLQNFLGISIRKEEVLQNGECETDRWSVLARCEEPLEERLWQRRTWLLGSSGRFALFLDYAFGDGEFPPGLSPGNVYQGTLAFYPSNFPQRAIPTNELQLLPETMPYPAAFDHLELMADQYAHALGMQPWLSNFPAVLELIPVAAGMGVDREQRSVPLPADEPTLWRLIAVSGGFPVRLFGEWNGNAFRPLAFWETPQIFRILQF